MVETGFVLIEADTNEELSDRANEPVEPDNEDKPAKISNQLHSSSKFIRLFVSIHNSQF